MTNYDFSVLTTDADIQSRFEVEASNRFEALTDTNDEDVQTTYDALVDICSHAAESVLPKRKRRSEQWVTSSSKKLIEERNQAPVSASCYCLVVDAEMCPSAEYCDTVGVGYRILWSVCCGFILC